MFGVGGCKDGEGEGRSEERKRKWRQQRERELRRVDKVSTIVRSCFFPHTDRSTRPVLWVRGTFMAMTTLHSMLVGYMVQCVCQQ